MISVELYSSQLVWPADLDFENLDVVRELPGKDAVALLLRELCAGSQCSDLIQDSHGWCFYVTRDGLRCSLELIPVSVESGQSSWMLQVFFEPGLRVWQHFHRDKSATEAQLSVAAITILTASVFGFSLAPPPTPN